ncbi:MAG: hypothetical protein LBI28_06970 [Treponema sp.]|nr:hypothetical protein [Treponema sp.]
MISILVLISFTGIIVITQKAWADDASPKSTQGSISGLKREREEWNSPEWIESARWFRSNAGGMALEEVASRYVALRSKYALVINNVSEEELPEHLISYYKEDYIIEVRVLYKNGEQIRVQWIFRDLNAVTRLNAVFLYTETAESETETNVYETEIIAPVEEIESEELSEDETETVIQAEEIAETVVLNNEELNENVLNEAEEVTEIVINDEKPVSINTAASRRGFIEIFDEDSSLTAEYRFFEDGRISRTNFETNDNLLIKATVSFRESAEKNGEFIPYYADFFRYNRSLSLRAVERIYYKDTPTDGTLRITFPRRMSDALNDKILINERLNLYPDYFGDVFIGLGSKMVFQTDERSRIVSQTLYDDEENVIWVINNTWDNNRIVSTSKTEGETVLLAEYQYNANGDRILERNSKNGILERVVRTEGKTDTEELYMNNVLVLRAVWEDGVKISETRVR